MTQDHAQEDRQRLIWGSATVVTLNEVKRRRAIAWLGSRWVLHPSNSTKRQEPKKARA